MLFEPLIAAPPRQAGLRVRLIDVLGVIALALLALALGRDTSED